MQKFNKISTYSNVIKHLLATTYLPLVRSVREGDYICKDRLYIFRCDIVKCTESGYIGKAPFLNNYPIAKWIRLDEFHFGEKDGKLSTNYISNAEGYDYKTHERLGQYLRNLRDMYGLNLMPLYNCFSNQFLENYIIKDSRIKKTAEDNNTKIYKIPIRFNQDYTVCIENQGITTFAPAFIRHNSLIKQNNTQYGNGVDLTNQYIALHSYDNITSIADLSFGKPFKIRFNNRPEKKTLDKITYTNMPIPIYSYEKTEDDIETALLNPYKYYIVNGDFYENANIVRESAEGFMAQDYLTKIQMEIPKNSAAKITSFLCNIESYQELNGYDKPWPLGAGKNKFYISAPRNSYYWSDYCGFRDIAEYDSGIVLFGTSQTDHTFSIPNQELTLPAGTYTLSVSTDNKCGIDLIDSDDVVIASSQNTSGTTFTLSAETVLHCQFNIISGIDFGWSTFIGFQIEEGNIATEFAPYVNFCPIYGTDYMYFNNTGVNFWDEEWEAGYLNNVGNDSSASGHYRSINYIPIFPDTSYYFKTPVSMDVIFYNTYQEFISRTTANNEVITVPSNAYYMKFTNTTANTWTPYQNDVSINYPSTDHNYYPYNHTYAEEWLPSIVYGGSINFKTGELIINKGVVDLSEGMSGGIINGNYVYFKELTDIPKAVSASTPANVIAEAYDAIHFNGVALNVGTVAIRDSNNYIYVNTGSQDNLPIGKAVYELDTPIIIQLTPQQLTEAFQQLELLTGVNNIWYFGGDLSINYETDMSECYERVESGHELVTKQNKNLIRYEITDEVCRQYDEVEDHLYLLIQVPKVFNQNIVVLEGDYTNLSSQKIVGVELRDILPDFLFDEFYTHDLNLMQATSTEPRPFSPVLVEFLLWNAICTLDTINNDMDRLSLLMHDVSVPYTDDIYKSYPNFWVPRYRQIISDYINSNSTNTVQDNLGYVTRNIEEFINRTRDANNSIVGG